MRSTLFLAFVPLLVASPTYGATGVTVGNVNLRSGPGTNYGSIRVLPEGTSVDIGNCDAAGKWCAITVKGQSGFASKRYLKEGEKQAGWPRSYDIGNGRLILYQPQISEWTDFKAIKAVVAAEFYKAAGARPVYGVIGVKGNTSLDEDTDEVVITDTTVTDLN